MKIYEYGKENSEKVICYGTVKADHIQQNNANDF